MKILSYHLKILLILMIFLNVTTFAAETNTRDFAGMKTHPLAELQEDFKQFQNIIMMEHPKLFADKNELNASFNEQYQNLKDNMNELEFFRILSPVVSKLNCGHTRLLFSKQFESNLQQSGRYLPLMVKIINNKAYVWRNLGNPEIPAGSEILFINKRPIPEIITILLKNLSADGLNVSKKYYEINHWFSDLFLSYVEAPEKYQISFLKPGSIIPSEASLMAVPKAQLDHSIKVTEPTDESALLPYAQQFTKDYAILRISSFSFYDTDGRKTFQTFLDQFFQKLAESKPGNLILDLRDNWGGDPYCSSYLFQYLITNPAPYFAADSPYYYDLKTPLKPATNIFQGNLYILINGACFSSTGHLCSLLKYHRIGKFIGEETGGSFICTDGSRDVTLKNTQLRFHYSTMAFKTAVSGLTPGRGIIPDYPINPAIKDYINCKDVEKEYAIHLIQKNQPAE